MSPCGPVMLPVNLSPSVLKVKVETVASPPHHGTTNVHSPVMSAAHAAANKPNAQTSKRIPLIVAPFADPNPEWRELLYTSRHPCRPLRRPRPNRHRAAAPE